MVHYLSRFTDNSRSTSKMIARLIRRILPERFRPIGYLTRLVRQRTDDQVRLGPFAGMRYIDCSVGSAYLPKLLGIYERELVLVIEEACACRPDLIVDLGAAEGYYAIGLALRNRHTSVIAFEQEATAQAALRRMAQLNGVADQIEIHGRCAAPELESCVRRRNGGLRPVSAQLAFIICDVEGDEQHLIDPQAVPSLRTALLLVETHEFIVPGISEELRRRFAPTHKIDCIWQSARTRAEFPFRSLGTWLLPNSYLDWALSEWRPERMCWLWMKPHD